MEKFSDLVMSRKSVRTYDGRKLTEEDRSRLEQYSEGISNPFDVPVKFVFLDAEECGLSSPVLSGEKLYVAGIVDKIPYGDVAFGYAFEQLVLYAWSLGIGTVWIGGTMKREVFEKAAGLAQGQMMPCVTPLGYPASKPSIKESLMRRGIKADERKSTEDMFFDGSYGIPWSGEPGTPGNEDMGEPAKSATIRRALELVRWAPSASNRQPWRIIHNGGEFHFYVSHDKGYAHENVGDMQKIDMGIALYHFVNGLREEGLEPVVKVADPGLMVPEMVEYVATVAISA